MSVRQSLLAILDLGPAYGQQLRTEFDRRTGSTWPLNAGQIYSTLDRLERDGLVRRAEGTNAGPTDADGQRRYEITADGRAEAHAWLATPVVSSAASRDGLAIKLAIALTLPGVDIAALIAGQRSATAHSLLELQERRDDTAEPTTSGELAALLVTESLVVAAEAELLWLDRAETLLRAAADAGRTLAEELSTEVPKRGRPFKVSATS